MKTVYGINLVTHREDCDGTPCGLNIILYETPDINKAYTLYKNLLNGIPCELTSLVNEYIKQDPCDTYFTRVVRLSETHPEKEVFIEQIKVEYKNLKTGKIGILEISRAHLPEDINSTASMRVIEDFLQDLALFEEDGAKLKFLQIIKN